MKIPDVRYSVLSFVSTRVNVKLTRIGERKTLWAPRRAEALEAAGLSEQDAHADS